MTQRPLRRLPVILWLAVFAIPRAQAAEPTDTGLPLQGTRTIEFTTDAVTWLSLDVAPDGQTIVFDALGDIYQIPITGGEALQLTSGMAMDSQPVFSPDGGQIAFVSDRDGSENVWLLAVDGSDASIEGASSTDPSLKDPSSRLGAEPRKLSDAKARVEFASPTFAPDGSHVVVSRTDWGLGTFELWGYHVAGGAGVQITKAKPSTDTARNRRRNALGAAYSPDGRYLYYARKFGGFAYNLYFPQWQIVRRDLARGTFDYLTQAQGSAFRPALSPDGTRMVYATRYDGQTGLRLRHLETGEDAWLVYPVQRDDQESRFTRDLFPGYAFTPDGDSVVYTNRGGIERVDVATRAVQPITFSLTVRQTLGPKLDFPYRIGIAPVKASVIQNPALSPDGGRVAFSALTSLYVHDLADGTTRKVSPNGASAFQPTWSPDGKHIAFVSWSAGGGHIWRIRANGRSRPTRLTERAAFYSDPAWAPGGQRIVALRAASYDRLYREVDLGAPTGSELVWLPSRGGEMQAILPSRGLTSPHFGPDADRIYFYLSRGLFPSNGKSGLTSLRWDGTDRRTHMTVKGPGIYYTEDAVPVHDIRLSPDGRHALVGHANQLHLVATLNARMRNVEVKLDKPALPTARLTDVGADFFGWSHDGQTIMWSVGDTLHRRPLASVRFDADAPDPAASDGSNDQESIAERHASVSSAVIDVYLPRDQPTGRLALVGATVISMAENAPPLSDAVVLVENGRITAVGPRTTTMIPPQTDTFDVAGHFLMPGFVDTHAHFRPMRNVLDRNNASFLANLAYGVTTGLDVQPSTVDVLAYRDLIAAGLMTGPRVLSTGPGIFSNNDLKSLSHTRAILRRYKRHYGVRNLKAYLAGNREQRQWIVQAAHELQLMPTTEGSLDMKLGITHVIDGFSGHEHNFPIVNLHRDVTQLVAESGIRYTPTLLVSTGGPNAEGYFYAREAPFNDPKLNRFTPRNLLAGRALRRQWFEESEHVFDQFARDAASIVRAGGRVGVGAHGQLQGLGYHWEMWALASGMSRLEVLTAATRHGAEMIGIGADIGTVTTGKLADFVILRGNPLDDIRHTTAIAFVVKNGEIYHGDSLDKLWPERKALADQWWWREPAHKPPVINTGVSTPRD